VRPTAPQLDQADEPVDAIIPLQLQPLNPDGLGGRISQEVVAEQAGRNTMAEDRALLPKPFSGTAEEDPAEFWRRLELFVSYKGLVAPEDLKLFKAMMIKGAQDWLEALDPAQKKTVAALKDAFNERFVKPPVLKFCLACDMFHKKGIKNPWINMRTGYVIRRKE